MKPITALIILDGFGSRAATADNAIAVAGTPNISRYQEEYPSTTLGASGLSVGLPKGQMGNSEVGHVNIGAGRVVYQELTRISKAIEDGDFFENPAFNWAMDHAKSTGSHLHLMGLMSDGGVHSHTDHLLALVDLAKQKGLAQVYIHCFLDGRDVPPQSGADFVADLEEQLQKRQFGKIATVSGRYYAMDRDKRWDRVAQAYAALTQGQGVKATDAVQAIHDSYTREIFDEFVHPVVIEEDGKPVATIKDNDSVIFFNFRPDRAREITAALVDPNFTEMPATLPHVHVQFVTMTQYDKNFEAFSNVKVAYLPQSLNHTFGEWISENGKTQLRIAETEKYAHVTFFFNGGVEKENPGEKRVLIPSPKVATYDLQPEMSAVEVANKAVECIQSGEFDCMILNFANPDMVGHTGMLEAAVAAIRAVDTCVGQVVEAVLQTGGACIITADHGNAEQMWDESTHGPYTAHTVDNPVPCILVGQAYRGKKLRSGGCLADLAPTMLSMMNLAQPIEMTGKSLIENA